ncbi:MAG: preprotein translocase subunit SecE [Limnohabitans sp.]|jgi:preprotein translocase subunit SecE|nr:preprotein translocase subunit SecE [Limnohabitans sp.]
MATANVETVNTSADKLKLAAAAGLVLAALVAYYLLGQKGALIQWAALLVCLVGGVVVFLSSLQGRRLIGFGRDAWREVQKVVWPTRKESMQMTAYVFGFVVIMALFLWFTDKTLEWVFYDLILGWKK